MNVQLRDITVTARDGRVSHLDQVYIRGSHVRFFIVPDMLRYVARFCLVGGGANEGVIGMLRCLGLELYVVEVLGWRGEGLRLTVRGASRAVGEGEPDILMGWEVMAEE